MTELILFIVVGGLAVAFAALMLLSDNAVHSALSLIVTMVCIAVLFLALNAPFLAMIQITVYAGAIMVLFLFVIMLLGAEKLLNTASPGAGKVRYRWFAPLALTLAMSLLIAVGVTFIQGQVSSIETPGPDPILRAVNVTGAQPLVVTANGVTVSDALIAAAPSAFIAVAPGDYEIVATFPDGTSAVTALALERGTAHTIAIYGDGAIAAVPEDLGTVTAERSARFALFNAHTEPLSVVDFGSEFVEGDERVLIGEVAPGAVSAPVVVPEGTGNWGVVTAANPTTAWFPLRAYEIARDRSTMWIATQQPDVNGVLRPLTVALESEARPQFGSPRAIGYSLFTDFLLPFQLLAVLLLASMVGAIVLTHREGTKRMPTAADRRRVSRPLAAVIAAQVSADAAQPERDAKALPEPETPEPVGK